MALVIVVIGIFAYTKFSSKITYTAPIVDTTSASPLSIDSDNDSLKDWEEGLWKTDVNNSDSDGDGTLDGAEIKLGRDPLVKGPNDKLDSETLGSKINPELEADLTETDKFSRELFVKVIATSKGTDAPTEADFQNFLNTTIKNQVEGQKARVYSSADLYVDAAETPEKIRVYGNAVATVLKTPPPQKLEYEINIVERAEAKKDPSELTKLTGNVAAYRKIETSLHKITVPKSAVKSHLDLMNGASMMAWSITGLSYLYSDPMKAIPGVAGYSEAFQKFILSIHSFHDYFENSHTLFDPNDAGYDFFDKI